jgi:hypothetical protein
MRLTYRAYRILSEDFTHSLQDATDGLQVRLLDRELDQVTRVDVPVSIEVLQRAKTVTVVIDEFPDRVDGPVPSKQNAPQWSLEQSVQGVQHDVRVGIWDSESGKQLVRWRGAAGGRLVSVGKRAELDPEIEGARLRQANSCFLATSLRDVIQRAVVDRTSMQDTKSR